MFVTSDIFDLEKIGRYRGFDWRENLLCGIAVHAARWPGHEAAATFLFEAARRCGLLETMRYAGYTPLNGERTRAIKPQSFVRLTRGELGGAQNARDVLLKGELPAVGTHDDRVIVGGSAGVALRRDEAMAVLSAQAGAEQIISTSAEFLFPINDRPADRAMELFRLAVDTLGAEYGYYFVRDALCFPDGYPCGIGAPLDWGRLSLEDSVEISDWVKFACHSLWSGKCPLLRDLYEINLLSKRHTSDPIEGLGYLTDWIAAKPGRGMLQEIGEGRLLWILTDAEIFNVRPLLNEAGLLLSCRDRVYRDLPQGLEPAAV